MKKKPARLNFKIKLEVFYSVIKPIIGFMFRDKEEFAGYGITEEEFTALDADLEEFGNIPTDQELLGMQISATQAKDKAGEAVRNRIFEIMTRVENKFGSNSGYYRKFGVSALSKMDGGELSTCARRVIRVATEFLEELQSEGLTQTMLDELAADLKTFDESISAQEDAIANRDIATEKRVDTANAIYAQLMKYCNTGKRIWEGKNEARYNDYVVYDTPTGKNEEEEDKMMETL